jgi:hypothetical protein
VLQLCSSSGKKHTILTAGAEAIAADGPRVNFTFPAGQRGQGTTDLTRLETSAFFDMSCPFGQAEFAPESRGRFPCKVVIARAGAPGVKSRTMTVHIER